MKVVRPSLLLADAAEVLAPVSHDVVVIGAAALEVALADATAAISPTRDVDVVVPVELAAAVVNQLERAGLRRSENTHERSFTWVKGDLKVQLVRRVHPFAKPPAKGLPQNPVFGMASVNAHQVDVAFEHALSVRRLVCAGAACLLALKEAAFGRTRAADGGVVQRDFHDAFLLMDAVPDDIVAGLAVAEHEVRQRALRAAARLESGRDETEAAAREMLRLEPSLTQRTAEAAVRRSARRLLRKLEDAGRPLRDFGAD